MRIAVAKSFPSITSLFKSENTTLDYVLVTFHCYLHFHSTTLVLVFHLNVLLYKPNVHSSLTFLKGFSVMHGKYCHKFVEVIGELLLSLLMTFATPLKTNTVISLANWYVNSHFQTRDGVSVSVQNLTKLTDKQMYKIRRIAHSKLNCFIFKLRRIICLTRIIQRITCLRRIVRL